MKRYRYARKELEPGRDMANGYRYKYLRTCIKGTPGSKKKHAGLVFLVKSTLRGLTNQAQIQIWQYDITSAGHFRRAIRPQAPVLKLY